MWLSGRLAVCVQSICHIQIPSTVSFLRHLPLQRPAVISSCFQARNISSSSMCHHNEANLNTLKKRPKRKNRLDEVTKGYNVTAYATAEEYDLERLLSNIVKQDLYERKTVIASGENPDFLYVTAKYEVDDEPREIFFFREGSVVLWNCPELECGNVLKQLLPFEIDSYDKYVVQDEREWMPYDYDEKAHMKKGTFHLSQNDTVPLEKYTFSNAMSTSVKLGIWEALLDKYVNSMAYVTEDLKKGRQIRISRAEVLRKTGELFALRHLINLRSDLLDTPDFYWDRDEFGHMYSNVCAYFSIQRRTKVMNEKLNHCVELAELISSNLNDKHHVRLEWMIIWLIMIEVLFECIHLYDRYSGHTATEEPAAE
ncbi:required for meiotic nuclear division protein 1 homolog [Bradysia coprophila]|uniref:required for meiotic nuclear division protein 1 homolog n=1 Tax=Bradysia coprophila TaxID=38358 RepID=UPI00187DB291|nr:required for meiotic nuclear division protein 1 homolog [Bradysia coprophila]